MAHLIDDNAEVRAMAQTLHDHDIDPCNAAAVCVCLIRSGWPAKIIERHYDEVILMALIRRTNAKRHTRTLTLTATEGEP